jgi:hypothetical protein
MQRNTRNKRNKRNTRRLSTNLICTKFITRTKVNFEYENRHIVMEKMIIFTTELFAQLSYFMFSFIKVNQAHI